MHDGVETELTRGQRIDKDTEILMKRVTTETRYKLGAKISFSVDEFKVLHSAAGVSLKTS